MIGPSIAQSDFLNKNRINALSMFKISPNNFNN